MHLTLTPKTKGSWSVLTVTILAMLALSFSTARAKALPAAARLVGPDAMFIIEIPDFDAVKSQLKKTTLHQLYQDPAMAPFITDAKSKWQEKIKKLDENNVLRALGEAEVWPTGRLAIVAASTMPTEETNEPPMMLIAEWGTNIDKIKDAIRKMLDKNIEMGGHSKPSENFQGVAIETAIDEGDLPFSYCFIDDAFLGCSDIETVKFAVAHIKGASSPSLADDPDYIRINKATGGQTDARVYFNLKAMVKAGLAQAPTPQAQPIVSALGVDSVTGMGLSFGVARLPGASFSGKGLLGVNGTKRGIFRMLEFQPQPIRAPRFIPASAGRLSFVNLSVKKMYDELLTILNAIDPRIASYLYIPLIPQSPDGEPGLQLKQDIIDHFGSQIILAQDMKKPFVAGSIPSEYLVAIGINNRRSLESSLSRLHDKLSGGSPDARRELLGHTLYLISPNLLPFFPSGPVQPMQSPNGPPPRTFPKLAFTFTDTHIILGLESGVEKAIRTARGGEHIATTKWYNQAKSTVPSATGIAAFEDDKATMELLWWVFKQQRKTRGKVNLDLAPGMGISEKDIDFELLPEFDKIKKYFGISTAHVISREDGFYMEFRDISPRVN